jgi:hypothetical protein
MNQYALHKAFQQVITTKTSLNDYVYNANPSDEIDGFESGDDIFDDGNENEEFIIPVQNTISNQNTMPIEITSYQSVTPSLATPENETVEQLIAGINQVSPINTNTAPILSNAPMVLPLNYGTQSYYQVPYNYPLQCNYPI